MIGAVSECASTIPSLNSQNVSNVKVGEQYQNVHAQFLP